MSGKTGGEPSQPQTLPNATNDQKKPTVKPRREFRHPVLQAMGISRLRIPGRNWLIFWAVTGTFLGGYWYDRKERRKVREEWKKRVSVLSQQPMSTMDLPRKVRVYLSPPPNDFLDAGMSHFRQYIKPILTAAAVDHELIVEESHQGHIRTVVAEEIRDRRREKLGLQPVSQKVIKDDLDRKIEQGLKRDPTGGVIIVGRGAYKEYMAGLHEGYLGPLEKPAKATEKEKSDKKKLENDDFDETKEPETEDEYNEKRRREMLTKYPVTEAYITVEDYPECTPCPELASTKFDPISVFRHPHLLGFLSTPWRVYRWMNQRYLADELCGQAAGVVFNQYRAFEIPEDQDLARSDEDDWPRRFKQQGLDKNSEWMRELKVDPRIGEKLSVYIPAKGEDFASVEDKPEAN